MWQRNDVSCARLWARSFLQEFASSTPVMLHANRWMEAERPMMVREILCEPIAGAAVDGFSFSATRPGRTAAVRKALASEESAAEARHAMRTHLDVVHGVGDQ